MNEVAKKVFWKMAKVCLALYAVGVGALALLKLNLPGEGLPWPEVFYGPAISMSCYFGLVALLLWWCSRSDRA